MKNWPKIQYNQVQFGINASLEINEKACDCSLFTGRRYVSGTHSSSPLCGGTTLNLMGATSEISSSPL